MSSSLKQLLGGIFLAMGMLLVLVSGFGVLCGELLGSRNFYANGGGYLLVGLVLMAGSLTLIIPGVRDGMRERQDWMRRNDEAIRRREEELQRREDTPK